MKYIKSYKIYETYSDKKEIKFFGFLNTDLLSTVILNNNSAILYLFNWGNYGKIRNFLHSIDESDFQKIEDWLTDRFRDEDIQANPNIQSISMINKLSIKDTDILSSYEDGEIGND